ncbi:MAG: TIGR00730 family Rossman fold protein [Candidatus Gastranaerophilaceae bacterium]
MTKFIKNVCVFSSSSDVLEDIYYKEANELGTLLAKNDFNLVYGGGAVGTMRENAKAVQAFGGKVIGVIPEKLNNFHNSGHGNQNCDELHVTKCMRTRKQKLDEISDAVIALAGGFGTLEELSEMIVQKQLGYNNKAIVILNTDGFYDNLLKFFDDIIEKNFAIEESREIYYVAKTPKGAVDYLINYVPENTDMSEKFARKQKEKNLK